MLLVDFILILEKIIFYNTLIWIYQNANIIHFTMSLESIGEAEIIKSCNWILHARRKRIYHIM